MTQTALSDDGEPLAYRVSGSATDRAPILTAHGLVSSIHHWKFFTPHFASQRRVISWEYRGHAGQPPPRAIADISVAQFADDAHAVWRASNTPPAIVVGLSFGVQVALEIYRRHPAMVRALVLVCGTPGHPLDRISRSPRLRSAVLRFVDALASQRLLADRTLAVLRSKAGLRIACELAYASGGAHRDACPIDVLEGLFAHVASLPPPLIAAVVRAYLEHDAEDVLPTIGVPTLIVAGDRDQLTPVSTAERMQRAIPSSELVVFPGHTHLVQVEQPEEVHAAIDRFLRDRGL